MKSVLVGVGVLLQASGAHAWDRAGHETVALIAEQELTEQAKAGVQRILNPGETLEGVAGWADDIRGRRWWTGGWHYVDAPAREEIQDFGPWCAGSSSCVVDQIPRQIRKIGDPSVDATHQREALMWLVHLVGDVHQPLHCADDGDLGGNQKLLRWHPAHGRDFTISLHALWDQSGYARGEEDPFARAIRLRPDPALIFREAYGTPAVWAAESHEVARQAVWPEFESGPQTVPAPAVAYSTSWRELADRQLQRAGIRLAWMLNVLFGSGG